MKQTMLIQDTEIASWRDNIRNHLFRNFRRDGVVFPAFIFYKVDDNGYSISTPVSLYEVDRDDYIPVLISYIQQFNPMAYVFINEGVVVLGDDYETMKKEFDKVGSVGKMKGAVRTGIFVFETQLISKVETYEIIDEAGHSVMNAKTLMDGAPLRDGMTGFLNRTTNRVTQFN